MRFIFSSNEGINFIIKLLLLFALFYVGSIGLIGITSPGGSGYSRFIDQHLNLIAWLRAAILHAANLVSNLLGTDSFVKEPFFLVSGSSGRRVQMVYSCIGYGIMSFWAAFVLAHAGAFKKKIIWLLAGLLIIFIINSCRVGIILVAIENNWNINRFADHHTTFNIVSYIFIFILIYFFTKSSKNTPAPGAA